MKGKRGIKKRRTTLGLCYPCDDLIGEQIMLWSSRSPRFLIILCRQSRASAARTQFKTTHMLAPMSS